MNELRAEYKDHLNKQGIKGENDCETVKLIDDTNQNSEEKSKQLISSILLHACDISTSLRDFPTSAKWSDL
jgi:hypothetical protein